MTYHSDEIPLDIGYSLAGLLPMHCVYLNFDTIKIDVSWINATFPIFKNCMYLSVTSIALNDVNVRGRNVINRLHEKSAPVKSLYRYSRLWGNESETMDM